MNQPRKRHSAVKKGRDIAGSRKRPIVFLGFFGHINVTIAAL